MCLPQVPGQRRSVPKETLTSVFVQARSCRRDGFLLRSTVDFPRTKPLQPPSNPKPCPAFRASPARGPRFRMFFVACLTESSRSGEDSVKTLLLAYGENAVHIAVSKYFSGRKYMPEGPDRLLPGPLCRPLVRYKLAPEHRSHNHFRPGNHWCAPPLS